MTGVLSFVEAQDHEASDLNPAETFEVIVGASNATEFSDDQTITVNIAAIGKKIAQPPALFHVTQIQCELHKAMPQKEAIGASIAVAAQLTIFENLPFLSCLNPNWKETAMRKSFYASQSIYSEPGPYRETLMRGGVELESMARWIGSFMQHPRGAESGEWGFKPEQTADLELRSVSEILSVAAKRNLLDGDSTQHKVGGVCRDFAILAVSGFRERGTPARLRVGFADYLVPGHWEDHWLCEWHDGRRWKLLDVEFAAIGGLSFDTSDVPRDRFLTASEAWLRIKEEPEIASRFGVSSLDLEGEWFVAGSLLREIAALRKLELKPWDYWGLSKDLSPVSTELSRQARKTLDNLASRLRTVTVDGEDGPEVVADWPLPKRVISFPNGDAVAVVLRDA